jgi:hypothetical protein
MAASNKQKITICQNVDVSSSVDEISISTRLDKPQQKNDEESNKNQECQNYICPQKPRFSWKTEQI